MMLRCDCKDKKCRAVLMSRSWALNCSTMPSTPTFTTAEFKLVELPVAGSVVGAAAGAAVAVLSPPGLATGVLVTEGLVVGVFSTGVLFPIAPGCAAAATAASIAASLE